MVSVGWYKICDIAGNYTFIFPYSCETQLLLFVDVYVPPVEYQSFTDDLKLTWFIFWQRIIEVWFITEI